MIFSRIFHRIGGRIFITFSLLLSCLTVMVSFVVLEFARRMITDDAANELRVLSVVLTRQVQRPLDRIEESLRALDNHGTLVTELGRETPDRKVLEDFLQNRLIDLPLFGDLAVFSRAGLCIGSTNSNWYGISAKSKSFFATGLKSFNFTEIYTTDEGEIQLVSTPITNGTSVRGVLVGQVNMDIIYELMDQKIGVSDSTDAFLLDSTLRFITPGRSGIEKLLKSHLVSTPLNKHLNEEFWVGRYKNYAEDDVLGTAMKVPGRQWYVVIEKNFNEVIRPLDDIKTIIALCAGVLLVALLLTTFYLSRSLTRPLLSLVGSAQKIALGDIKNPLSIPRGIDEVTFLAQEFEKMRAKVADFQDRLLERLEESERKRIENEHLAAIGTLASTLAHEIRNPLNAMSLLLARLEMLKDSQRQSEVVRNLRGEIGRLDRLVSDILDYARPVQLAIKQVDMVQLIKSTCSIYSQVFDSKRITLKLELNSEELWLMGDSDRLKQCLVNLLQNSIDAITQADVADTTGHGHQIEIHAKKIENLIPNQILIEITDDGIGLPKGNEGRLFDLFFSTKEQGTGIGLSTVRKIVNAHSGTIELEKLDNKHTGTLVRMHFPAAVLGSI